MNSESLCNYPKDRQKQFVAWQESTAAFTFDVGPNERIFAMIMFVTATFMPYLSYARSNVAWFHVRARTTGFDLEILQKVFTNFLKCVTACYDMITSFLKCAPACYDMNGEHLQHLLRNLFYLHRIANRQSVFVQGDQKVLPTKTLKFY